MIRFKPEMIAAARAGDRVSIDALLVIARPDIHRYARQKCRSPSDAEDAVQETLFILYRHFAALRPVGSLSAWLFTVVYRQCLRLSAKLLFAPVDIEAVDREGKLRSVPDEELRLDLAHAIEALPAHYRTVIVLRDIEELTVNEIAEQLGTSREAIKARLNRARTLLRTSLLRAIKD